MCGIHGIYRFDGQPVTPEHLSAMGGVTLHRGPDDEGMHLDGACGIGMRRLSIIDLSGGHQPLSSGDRNLWLVCNGEIYNYRQLRRAAERKGYRFKTNSDCEVMLALYQEYGDNFVQRLNGMFAFALWDSRRNKLLLGRDRLGIKPLYFMRDGKQFAFASEAKALLALPDTKRDLDLSALEGYLHLGYVPAPQSLFAGIEKLSPATLMTIQDGRVNTRRYWQPPQSVDRGLDEAEWTHRVRAQMLESVGMQMVSDVPIGAFLSGGLDSSAVVAFMAEHSDKPIKTYAIGFEGEGAERLYNELPFARRVSQLFETEHHEIVVKPDVIDLLPQLLWHMDEPIADSAFITTYLVSEFARRDVTVILSGVGGDELFGGYRRYLGHRYHRYFKHLPAWMRRNAAAFAARLPADRGSPLLNLTRYAKGFLAGADASFDARYRSYVQVFAPDQIEALRRADHYSMDDALQRAFGRAYGDDALNRLLTVDAETQLPDDLLMLTDKMSMAVSLECRVPLLDHTLVELAARMPEDIKMRGGALKYLLKQSLADVLPKDILHRKKRGFGTPMGAWMKRELAPVMAEILSEKALRSRGLFDPATVRTLMQEHAANRIDGTDQLLALLSFEVWARIYLDGRSPGDVRDELKSYCGHALRLAA